MRTGIHCRHNLPVTVPICTPQLGTSSGFDLRIVQSDEARRECITRHFTPQNPVLLIIVTNGKMDAIVSVYTVYSDVQSTCIAADVAGRELKITDHMSLR